MALQGEQQTTLHDTIAATFDEVIPPQGETPAASTDAPAEAVHAEAPPVGETAEAKAARERDELGRFAKKTEPAAAPAKAATPTPQAPAATPAPAAEPAKPAIQRPSSWKKDHWEAFDKLAADNPVLAQYILQRETEAARGVSAYKNEWDRAKPMLEAVAPYLPMYQQHGIDPGKQFAKYAEIHKAFALGNEEQKLGMLLSLAQDYKIPMEKLFVQQNGQLFYNPQVQPSAPQPQAQQPQDIERTVQAVIARERTQAQIDEMSTDAVKYPHFETLRETMAQLLDAKLANDLPGAYEMALALPQHRELAAAALAQAQAAEETARKQKAAAEAQRARAAAVSPKSATPASGPVKTQKGLRDTIAEQLDAVASGRV